jgi:tetratricopeptide (TPR) repeat protein
MPEEPRYWNNLGLFLRDEGERLEIDAHENKTPAPDPALLEDLYGRAYAAYQRALELHPDDPQLICDTAVMLTYHIGGEKTEVEAMYRHALALVEARLAASDLTAEDRARFEQTRDDIGVNLKALLQPEKEEGTEEAAAPETTPITADGNG